MNNEEYKKIKGLEAQNQKLRGDIARLLKSNMKLYEENKKLKFKANVANAKWKAFKELVNDLAK